jgi:hypothetical protein
MVLTIYQDTRYPGTCRSCGAVIEWAQLTSGKRMPFDKIVPLREQPVLFDGDRRIEEIDTASSPTHFQSCPDARDWRRRRTGALR